MGGNQSTSSQGAETGSGGRVRGTLPEQQQQKEEEEVEVEVEEEEEVGGGRGRRNTVSKVR